jgi:hypothetical protein
MIKNFTAKKISIISEFDGPLMYTEENNGDIFLAYATGIWPTQYIYSRTTKEQIDSLLKNSIDIRAVVNSEEIYAVLFGIDGKLLSCEKISFQDNEIVVAKAGVYLKKGKNQ